MIYNEDILGMDLIFNQLDVMTFIGKLIIHLWILGSPFSGKASFSIVFFFPSTECLITPQERGSTCAPRVKIPRVKNSEKPRSG